MKVLLFLLFASVQCWLPKVSPKQPFDKKKTEFILTIVGRVLLQQSLRSVQEGVPTKLDWNFEVWFRMSLSTGGKFSAWSRLDEAHDIIG